MQGSHGRMSGRSQRQQWRRLSVIEPNDNELPAKPTQRTGEPEAPARASVPERFRRLKRNEVVWSGDFVADERLGFELWEAPGVSRAGSFARPIYRKEETERFRPTSTRKPKQKITAYLEPNCGWSKGVRAILGESQSALRRSRYHQQSAQLH